MFACAAAVLFVTTGASLTALITRPAVSVALEKAVAPPFVDVSAKLPLVPLVRSQARKVIALARVPLKFAFGWKYSRLFASAASKRAFVFVTAPSACQLVPL